MAIKRQACKSHPQRLSHRPPLLLLQGTGLYGLSEAFVPSYLLQSFLLFKLEETKFYK